jgi:hypothetical protein
VGCWCDQNRLDQIIGNFENQWLFNKEIIVFIVAYENKDLSPGK